MLKAYGTLESDGIAEGRRGQGTFVKSSAPAPLGDDVGKLRRSLRDWFGRARAAGLDDQAIEALLSEQRGSGSARTGGVTAALETRGLGKRYGSQWALRDCTLEIPRGLA